MGAADWRAIVGILMSLGVVAVGAYLEWKELMGNVIVHVYVDGSEGREFKSFSCVFTPSQNPHKPLEGLLQNFFSANPAIKGRFFFWWFRNLRN